MVHVVSAPLLESVPNVSVGVDVGVVDAIVTATRAGIERGARHDGSRALLADVHRDVDHDRSVLTLLGRGEALAGGLEALARATVELVDLRVNHGVHPRLGALDVLPVIALDAGEPGGPAAARALVDRLARLLGDDLHVPVVRYGLDEDGSRLDGADHTGAIRRGGITRVLERIAGGELEQLAGPVGPHESAGITVAGVRQVLVACNVDLDTEDVEVARAIAARIRASSDARERLPGVRALGLALASRGVAQVSTNIEQPRVAGPAHVLEHVVRIAAELGVGVRAVELVGLAPDGALGALRYACIRHGVTLLAGASPSIDVAAHAVGR